MQAQILLDVWRNDVAILVGLVRVGGLMPLGCCKCKLGDAVEAVCRLHHRRSQVLHRLDHVWALLQWRFVRDRMSMCKLFVLEDIWVKVFEFMNATSCP